MGKLLMAAALVVAVAMTGYLSRHVWLWRVEPTPNRLTIVRWGTTTPRVVDNNSAQVAALYASLANAKQYVSMDTKCSFALYRLTFYRGHAADGWANLDIPCSGMKVDIAGVVRYVQVPEFRSAVWEELATIWHVPKSKLIKLGRRGRLPGVQKYRMHSGQ